MREPLENGRADTSEVTSQANEDLLAAIIGSAMDAIIAVDGDHHITLFNGAAERMFHYPSSDTLGQPLTHFVPLLPEQNLMAGGLWQGRRRDGAMFPIQASVSPMKAGESHGLALILRDVTQQQAHEAELERFKRLYAALSHINHAIVWTGSREDLLRKICRALLEQGGFCMAWIGWHEPTAKQLLPVAHWGDENGYLKGIKVYTDDRPEGNGISGKAFRNDRPYISNDMLTDPATLPWREEIERRGFLSAGAFPIHEDGKVQGLLSVYALEPGFFQDKEISLLAEAAADISFALGNLTREQERQAAETLARSERLFSDTMIESMPGILYFYDAQGKFLRWNRNFETVSGYSGAEIAAMHPLDFFPTSSHDILKERIAETLRQGESTLEAPFLAKDGTITPYFFTGRRVEFNGRICLVGVGIDISERKQTESALEKSERRFRTTLDTILEGCQLLAFDWRYLYLNDAAAIHNRRPKADLLGRTMPECWPGIEHSHVYKLIERCLKERIAAHEEVEFAFADGTKGWFDIRIEPVEEGALVLSIEQTAQKLANDRLTESERKYRELVENANSIILRWNSEGHITLLNEFGQRFFGYPAEEIIGRHVLDTIVPATESSGRDLQQLMVQICADPKAFEQNINENIRRNGQRVWISWTNRIVHDAQGNVEEILSIGTDITEQKRANEALQRSEEQFRLIMENLADLVALVDVNGRRLYNSPSYQAILGNPRKLLGSSSFEQIHPDDQARVKEAFEETVRSGVGHRLEYRLLDVDKQPRHIESQGSVIRDAQGKPAQVVVVSRDVTERRQAELALRVLNETLELEVQNRTSELQSALVRAEAADRIKSAFLATMSHELRTPLNSIIGFTGIILQGLAGPLNPEQTKQLGMVRGSARHLLELINDVLDISKIEAGQLEVRAEPFDLRASIERVAASVKPLADKKGLTLTVTLPPDLGEMISDRRRVEQVLINLLNNALKFTDRGGVTLVVEKLAGYQLAPGEEPVPVMQFRVKDTGIGIKPENLELLFLPFRQIDTGLSRQHEGTGLGLAICRRLAVLMGGDITATSEWQQGTEFAVVLPLKREVAS